MVVSLYMGDDEKWIYYNLMHVISHRGTLGVIQFWEKRERVNHDFFLMSFLDLSFIVPLICYLCFDLYSKPIIWLHLKTKLVLILSWKSPLLIIHLQITTFSQNESCWMLNFSAHINIWSKRDYFDFTVEKKGDQERL